MNRQRRVKQRNSAEIEAELREAEKNYERLSVEASINPVGLSELQNLETYYERILKLREELGRAKTRN